MGSAPGRPRHTGQTFVLGGAPNAVEQPQNILDTVRSCTCVSSPMTVSHSGVAVPAIRPPRSPARPAPARTPPRASRPRGRSEEHTSELQSRRDIVCRLLLEKKKKNTIILLVLKKKKKKKK